MFPYSQPEVKVFLARLFCRVRFEVEGLAHMPASGPVILVMNHTGWEEILLTILAVPRPLSIVGMRDLLFLDDPKGRARIFDSAYASHFGFLRKGLTTLLGNLLGEPLRRQMLQCGFIPTSVFTETWRPILGTNGTRDTLNALDQEQVVLIFPEGGYKRDGVMRPFKPGIGLLLRLLKRRSLEVTLLPAAQRTAGSISLTLGNRYVPRLIFGSPLMLPYNGSSARDFDRNAARIIQDRVNALLPEVWDDPPLQTYSFTTNQGCPTGP